MAQWLKTLSTLPKDQGLAFSTYMAAHNSLTPVPRDLMPSTGLQGHEVFMQCIDK